ncbi:MAG: hypothetical protein QE570_07425, partial [Verrucomicrobiota bacterium]|nr:hypothetical protein [Verrucomicrobiota bacterium]
SWAVGDVVALMGLDSIHTLISGYSNLYSGLFTTETPYSVAHFRRKPWNKLRAYAAKNPPSVTRQSADDFPQIRFSREVSAFAMDETVTVPLT